MPISRSAVETGEKLSICGYRTDCPTPPLAPGASINVRFLPGIKQTGTFRFYVTVEALP